AASGGRFPRTCHRARHSTIISICGTGTVRSIVSTTRFTCAVAGRPRAKRAPPPPSSTARASRARKKGGQDRDGGALLVASLFGAFPFLVKLYAGAGYQGPQFRSAMKRILARVNVEIVKRSDQAKGFVTLPKRWIVERTLAWLGRCRRLAKDWECLNRKALAFLRLASIRLMLRKLCNPA